MSLRWKGELSKSGDDFTQEKEFLFKLNNTVQRVRQVRVLESAGHVASTDLGNIYLNFPEIKNVAQEDYFNFLVFTKAFNYHELCHIMYTKYGQYIDWHIRSALNTLEDQRIENIFSRKYGKASYYFKMLSVGYILKNGIKAEHYTLLYGRRLIIDNKKVMKEMRKLALEKWGEIKVVTAEKIIDTYLITTDVKDQKELARLFADLFKDDDIYNPLKMAIVGTKDKKRATKEEKQITEELQEDIEKESIEEESEEEVKEETVEEHEQKKESDESNDEDAKEEEAISDSADEDEGDSDSGSGGKSEEANNSEDESSKSTTNDNKSEEIEDILEEVMEEAKEHVSSEIKNQMRSMEKKDFTEGILEDAPQMVFTPEVKHIKASRKLEKAIKLMKNDLDNRITYNQKRGKINLRKAMSNNSYKINDFKKFIPSRLAKTKLGVSIIFDSSGSMDEWQSEIAIASSWCVATALENTGSSVEVYEFASQFRKVKDFGESVKNASWGRDLNGGTYVRQPLEAAEKTLKDIKLKHRINNRMVIIMTDGSFHENDLVERLTRKFKDNEIYVALFNVVSSSWGYYANNNKEAYNKIIRVQGFSKLPVYMAELIKDVQAKVIHRVKTMPVR